MQAETRPGTRLMDRAEYRDKPKPLTAPPTQTVADAVSAMNARNYGSVVVTDDDDKVIGVMTERDIFRRVIGENRDEVEGVLLAKDLLRYMNDDARAEFDINDILQAIPRLPTPRVPLLVRPHRHRDPTPGHATGRQNYIPHLRKIPVPIHFEPPRPGSANQPNALLLAKPGPHRKEPANTQRPSFFIPLELTLHRAVALPETHAITVETAPMFVNNDD